MFCFPELFYVAWTSRDFVFGWGWVENVFEFYSSGLTPLVLVVYLYLAYLIPFDGWGWVVENSDLKENPKSDLDLDLGFVKNNKTPQPRP